MSIGRPVLEAEFERSQAKDEAEKASRIARSEAELAGAAADPGDRTPPIADDIAAGVGTAAALELLNDACHEIAAAGAPQDSVKEHLAKLQRLRDRGVLSTGECEAQRQRILQSL